MCEYLSDVLPPEQMYQSANTASKSKHGLKQESWLEAFHGLSADFANTSMRESLADVLTIQGTADANSDVRERIKFETMDTQDAMESQSFTMILIKQHWKRRQLLLVLHNHFWMYNLYQKTMVSSIEMRISIVIQRTTGVAALLAEGARFLYCTRSPRCCLEWLLKVVCFLFRYQCSYCRWYCFYWCAACWVDSRCKQDWSSRWNSCCSFQRCITSSSR